MLGPLLNSKSDLYIRNGVLLYKQIIRPMIDYACPAWRSAARTDVRRLQVLQFKCLRLAAVAPWYISNRQIHEDLGVPLLPTASIDSKLTDVGNPLVRQVGRYADRGLTPSHDANAKCSRGQQASRGQRPPWPSRLNESRLALISRASFGYPE